jgi:ABC-type sugar transport system permease subunit
LTEGGPNHARTVMGFYLWENAYRYSQQGYAAAIGVIILAVTMILYFISKKLLNQETYQY